MKDLQDLQALFEFFGVSGKTLLYITAVQIGVDDLWCCIGAVMEKKGKMNKSAPINVLCDFILLAQRKKFKSYGKY